MDDILDRAWDRPCCINFVTQLSSSAIRSGGNRKDVEELIDESDLILDMGFTGKTVSSTDHTRHLEALDCGSRCLHRLKASGGTNDSL